MIVIKAELYRKNKILTSFSYNDYCNMILPLERGYSELIKSRIYAKSELFIRSVDSIMSDETKYKFAQLIQLLISEEMKIEIWRQKLNKMRNFIIKNIFEKIDYYGNGFITEYDISDYLNKCNVVNAKFDIISLISRFNKDNSGKVTYSQVILVFINYNHY